MCQCWLVRIFGARILSKKSVSVNCWYPWLLYHSFGHKEQILEQRMTRRRGVRPELKEDSIVEKCFWKYCWDFFFKLLDNTSLKAQLAILGSLLILSCMWVFFLQTGRTAERSKNSKQFSSYKTSTFCLFFVLHSKGDCWIFCLQFNRKSPPQLEPVFPQHTQPAWITK